MATSCSRWWRAPIYFAVSVVLAVIAISTGLHSNPDSEIPSKKAMMDELTMNASRALRGSGFNIIATLLQISPELFLSSSESTVFAIKDSAIFSISHSPRLMKELVQYHTSPSKLSMQDLLMKPQGSCFPTLLRGKNIAITKIDAKQRSIEINHALISHADIFLGGPISIHGVLGPFASLDRQDILRGWALIRSPICDSNHRVVSNVSESKNTVEWNQIVRLLGSNGFVSFAIGLHSVLDDILEDYEDLSKVTIFAPPDLTFLASPSPLPGRTVRLHILPQRFTCEELASMPKKASLGTLLPDSSLEITGRVNVTQLLAINGVEITAPNIFSSKNFIVHGISRALAQLAELANAS